MKFKPWLITGILLAVAYLFFAIELLNSRSEIFVLPNEDSYATLTLAFMFFLISIPGYSIYSLARNAGDFPSLDLDFNIETQIFGFFIIILVSAFSYFVIGVLIGGIIELLYQRFTKRRKKTPNTP